MKQSKTNKMETTVMETTNISFDSRGKLTNYGGAFIGWKYSKYTEDPVSIKTSGQRKNLQRHVK